MEIYDGSSGTAGAGLNGQQAGRQAGAGRGGARQTTAVHRRTCRRQQHRAAHLRALPERAVAVSLKASASLDAAGSLLCASSSALLLRCWDTSLYTTPCAARRPDPTLSRGAGAPLLSSPSTPSAAAASSVSFSGSALAAARFFAGAFLAVLAAGSSVSMGSGLGSGAALASAPLLRAFLAVGAGLGAATSSPPFGGVTFAGWSLTVGSGALAARLRPLSQSLMSISGDACASRFTTAVSV